jgi:hypothetical protein
MMMSTHQWKESNVIKKMCEIVQVTCGSQPQDPWMHTNWQNPMIEVKWESVGKIQNVVEKFVKD